MLGGERLYVANRKAHRYIDILNNISAFNHWEDEGRERGLLRKTRVRCSCWMCGHRRDVEGLPIRDKRKLPLKEEFE